MNARWLSVALPLALAVAGFASASPEQVKIGDLDQRVFAIHGKPTRQIGTDAGALLFYGPMLVAIEGGVVRLVSFASAPPAPAEPAMTTVPPLKSKAASRGAGTVRSGVQADGTAGPLEIRIAERLRRLVAMEMYAAMVESLGSTVFNADGGRWGGGRRVSWLGIRDSRSCRIERYGEDVEVHDRYVTLEETLEASWSGDRSVAAQ